jgi:hypothetical protein
MKKILIIIAFALGIYSCSSNAEVKNNNLKNDNYVVVLDLSDRIIQKPDQVDIDTNAIRAAFEKFEESVQKNLVVKSRDKFSIRIIPQKLSSLPGNTFENTLSIDLGKYNAAEKLKHLNEFKRAFGSQLNLLYQQAYLGNKTSDFAGVDIWQYFNEQINSDLDSKYNNKVLVITDGYFDFEDKKHGITKNNFSTTTSPLLMKMNSSDWQKIADSNEIGLLPVKLTLEAKWLVCGLQPKVGNTDLLESEKLSYLWKKWLLNSGAKNIEEPIINSSSLKMKNLILKSL